MGSPAPSVHRAVLVALARAVNAALFLTTSSYCLLTYSSFAYQQFIKPYLVNWLTGFVVWHHLAFWLMLMITGWTLVPHLGRGRGRGRWRGVAWSYLAVWTAAGIVLLLKPILPQVGLSTDITPTLYGLLGHPPADLGSLYGRSLLVPRDQSLSPRAEPLLIASSYGGVYAVLHGNGSRMYIADGVNGRDYAYALSGASPVRIGITPANRTDDQRFIRSQIDEISRAYHFVAEP